jgi:sporulation protein YlmC with PRC-barrel domain
MSIWKPVCVLGGTVLWALAAIAQQEPPAEKQPPAEKPPMAQPAPGQETAQPPAAQKRAVTPSETPAGHDLVGLNVFSSDGSKVGEVKSVNTNPNGNVAALHIKTGGFLGFGGRIVAIPEGRFAKSGQNVQLNITADQVSKLPEVKDGN